MSGKVEAEQQMAESWRENAGAWTDAVRQGRIQTRTRVTNNAVVAAVLASDAATVLDAGCGEGWLCRALSDAGRCTCGFDGSPELIAAARDAAPSGDYRVLSYGAFAAEPRQVGGPFDAAVCNFSLLGEDLSPILGALATVLRPAGSLIIQTVHPLSVLEPGRHYADGWRSEDFATVGPGFTTSMPWYFRTVSSWLRLTASAGFDLAACDEPLHPDTGLPASLLLTARLRDRP